MNGYDVDVSSVSDAHEGHGIDEASTSTLDACDSFASHIVVPLVGSVAPEGLGLHSLVGDQFDRINMFSVADVDVVYPLASWGLKLELSSALSSPARGFDVLAGVDVHEEELNLVDECSAPASAAN